MAKESKLIVKELLEEQWLRTEKPGYSCWGWGLGAGITAFGDLI
jgi:hypothetical protein